MTTTQTHEPKEPKVEVFTFGDPEPVLDRGAMIDHIESAFNGRYYDPPVSMDGLARSFRASSHHASALQLKRNLVMQRFKPSPLLSYETMERLVTDDLVFGNCYLEEIKSATGKRLKFDCSPSKYTRIGKDGNYWFINNGYEDDHLFENKLFHIQQVDIHQEIYGVPEYLGCMQAAWLNESATLFRRRYYNNGSHAGFILYVNDAAASEKDVAAIREAMKNSKGPGNFRNLFFYSPNGKKDGIQLIPISEVSARDDFFNIKNVSRDDILAAHRVPPQLLGMVPANAGGFGSVQEAATVFVAHEISPLLRRYERINELVGQRVVQWHVEAKSAIVA